MNYEKRIVAFIDILGFEKLIDETINEDGTDNIKKIATIVHAIEIIRGPISDPEHVMESSKVVTQFSDSLVISFHISEESKVFYTLLEIQRMIMNLVFEGILCRGGIAFGKLVHNEKLIFGPAMVEAHKLESKVANYPRIILSEQIINIGIDSRAMHHNKKQESEHIKSRLGKDPDGMYYLDYFIAIHNELEDPVSDYSKYLHKLSEIIRKGLLEKDPAVKIKYQWMKEKYNKAVERMKNSLSSKDWERVVQVVKDDYKALPIFP